MTAPPVVSLAALAVLVFAAGVALGQALSARRGAGARSRIAETSDVDPRGHESTVRGPGARGGYGSVRPSAEPDRCRCPTCQEHRGGPPGRGGRWEDESDDRDRPDVEAQESVRG